MTTTKARRPILEIPEGLMPKAKRGRSKYRNERTRYNGITYDSAGEARWAAYLDQRLRSGEIRAWTRQVTVMLGVPENKVRIDFLVWGNDGSSWFEEFKGTDTPAWKKNKVLWKRYGPAELRVIKAGKAAEIIRPGKVAEVIGPEPTGKGDSR
jgi:hypothetical protein